MIRRARRWRHRDDGEGYRFIEPYPKLLLCGQIVLLLDAIVRGLNYFATPTGATVTVTAIESSVVGGVWGWALIAWGALGIVTELGMVLVNSNRAWLASFIAHAGLAGMFLTSSASAWVGIAGREPFYGFSTPTDLVLICVGHIVFLRARRAA